MVRPDATKGLPGFLHLYVGLRLILNSKDCVRFGVMKGCPCVLRHIVFADDEVLPVAPVGGQPYSLVYMPTTLLLQVEGADWELPPTELPATLPKGVNKRGLFQLRPSFDYLRARHGAEYFSVRRTSFLVMPADTLTVYAAQGSTFDAVIADMQRPPNLDHAKHWLACYVMLSRARSIEGFLLLRPAAKKELENRPPQYLLDELARLSSLERSSTHELRDYLASLPIDVPEEVLDLLADDAIENERARVATIRKLEVPSSFSRASSDIPRRRIVGKRPPPPHDARASPTAKHHRSVTTADSTLPFRPSPDAGKESAMTMPFGPSSSAPSPSEPQLDADAAPIPHKQCSAGTSQSTQADAEEEPEIPAALGTLGLTAIISAAAISRGKAADAAEERTEKNKRRGIGNPDLLPDTTTQSKDKDVFGAKRRQPLREQLAQSRRKLAARSDEATLPSPPCSSYRHSCQLDTNAGCTSCNHVCHTDCRSHLCRITPCEHCCALHVPTHVDSEMCRDVQRASGCHCCNRVGCWATSDTCPSRMPSRSDEATLPSLRVQATSTHASSILMRAALPVIMCATRIAEATSADSLHATIVAPCMFLRTWTRKCAETFKGQVVATTATAWDVGRHLTRAPHGYLALMLSTSPAALRPTYYSHDQPFLSRKVRGSRRRGRLPLPQLCGGLGKNASQHQFCGSTGTRLQKVPDRCSAAALFPEADNSEAPAPDGRATVRPLATRTVP